MEGGLLAHPDGRTLIYPLGSTIVLRDKFDARAQEFLQGHSDKVRGWCWGGGLEVVAVAVRRPSAVVMACSGEGGGAGPRGRRRPSKAELLAAGASKRHPHPPCAMGWRRASPGAAAGRDVAGVRPGAVEERAVPGDGAGHLHGLHGGHHHLGPGDPAAGAPHGAAQGWCGRAARRRLHAHVCVSCALPCAARGAPRAVPPRAHTRPRGGLPRVCASRRCCAVVWCTRGLDMQRTSSAGQT